MQLWVEGEFIKYYESMLELKNNKKWQPVNLMTRNCALLPKAISNHSKLRPAEERLDELIDSIKDAGNVDVLCLQEVFGSAYAEALINGLKDKFKYFL